MQATLKINVVLEKEVQAAREALKQGNKKRALLALKKKKYQEQLLERTDQQLANLEELASVRAYHIPICARYTNSRPIDTLDRICLGREASV